MVVKAMIGKAVEGDIEEAHAHLESLWSEGYAASDIISTLFRVVRNEHLEEYLKLEFIKVLYTFAIAY